MKVDISWVVAWLYISIDSEVPSKIEVEVEDLSFEMEAQADGQIVARIDLWRCSESPCSNGY